MGGAQQEITMTDLESGIQYRTNPCRDIAFFGPQIFETIGERCKPENLTPDDKLRLVEAGLQPEEVLEAWISLAMFHKLALETPIQSPAAAADACGFSGRPWVAQSIVAQKYMRAMMGAVWAGLRSSTMQGETPVVVSKLLASAKDLLVHFESK